jgi:hypothetical protein
MLSSYSFAFFGIGDDPRKIYATTIMNGLTKSYADTLYCQQNGDCKLSNLTVTNINYTTINVTISNLNITGNLNVSGTVNSYGYFVNGTPFVGGGGSGTNITNNFLLTEICSDICFYNLSVIDDPNDFTVI